MQELISAEERSGAALVADAEAAQAVAVAKAHPRDVQMFRDKARSLATLNEDIAAECSYALPRGGKTITGPSTRFMEILVSCYQNVRAAARVVHEDRHFVVAQGTFVDLENNTQITIESRRRITDKRGDKFNDDMIGVTSNAACSIALRGAIGRGIPKAFWSDIWEDTQRVTVGESKPLENLRHEALAFLQRHGATEKAVLRKIGRATAKDITREDIITLRGFATALKDGEMTVENMFPEEDERESKPKTVGDILDKRGQEAAAKKEEIEKAAAEAANRSIDKVKAAREKKAAREAEVHERDVVPPTQSGGSAAEEPSERLDKHGLPWNEEFHSSNKKMTANGEWSVRRFRGPNADVDRKANHARRIEWENEYLNKDEEPETATDEEIIEEIEARVEHHDQSEVIEPEPEPAEEVEPEVRSYTEEEYEDMMADCESKDCVDKLQSMFAGDKTLTNDQVEDLSSFAAAIKEDM